MQEADVVYPSYHFDMIFHLPIGSLDSNHFVMNWKKIHKTNGIVTCSSHSSQLQSTVLLAFQRHTTQLGRVATFEWEQDVGEAEPNLWNFLKSLFHVLFNGISSDFNVWTFLVILRSGIDSWPRQVKLFLFFFLNYYNLDFWNTHLEDL